MDGLVTESGGEAPECPPLGQQFALRLDYFVEAQGPVALGQAETAQVPLVAFKLRFLGRMRSTRRMNRQAMLRQRADS